MAIYHLNVSTGNKADGQSAEAKAQYILRAGRYRRGKAEVLFSASENIPAWAANQPLKYWQAADIGERSNGVLFRQVEFALPLDLKQKQQIALAKEFSQKIAGEKLVLPYTMALHKGKGHNPHCHLLLSERIVDGCDRTPETWFRRAAPAGKTPDSGGGARKADIGSKRKAWLAEIRETWATLANAALEKAGLSARIDHRSLAEQGSDHLPGVHMGPNVVEMEERGVLTDRAERVLEVAQTNHQIEELKQVEKEIRDEKRLGESSEIPEHAGRNRSPAPAVTGVKSENRQSAKPGRGHGQGAQAPPTAAPAASKQQLELARPTSGPVSHPQGESEMNSLSPRDYQEFLRVRRKLAAQQQVEELRQRLSEKQKQRFLELERLAEEAERTRHDHRYLDHDFAWGCVYELKRQHKTVETADWGQTESRVATQLLANGANVADVADLVFDLGLSATTGSPIPANALEYLKNLATSSPALADAMRTAERREKDEELQRQQQSTFEDAPHKQSIPLPSA